MPDDVPSPESAVPRCPWCSAELVPPDVATCSSCGASLHAEGEPQVPGVTAIDPMAVLEGSREPRRPRNRLLAWLSGDAEDAASVGVRDREALAPPDPAVRREMLRLEMEAELSSLSAEAESIASDEAVEAAEDGDQVASMEAIRAIQDSDAATDALVETPEELQVKDEGPAEVGEGLKPGEPANTSRRASGA